MASLRWVALGWLRCRANEAEERWAPTTSPELAGPLKPGGLLLKCCCFSVTSSWLLARVEGADRARWRGERHLPV